MHSSSLLALIAISAAALGACSSGGDESQVKSAAVTGSGGAATSTTASASSSGQGGEIASTSSGGGNTNVGGGFGMPSDIYPAPHPAFPQVQDLGGAVLANPEIHAVFFMNGDPTFVPKLSDFVATLGDTPYWAATTAEYGVGPATAAPPIMVAEDATGMIDDSAIKSWLAAKFNTGDAAFPTPNANTLIVLFYPSAVTLTLGGEVACKAFGSFHSSTELDAAHGNMNVAYAAIQRCDNFFPGITGVNESTVFATHEIVEAVTDPRPAVTPAYAIVDDADLAWLFGIGGGEVADLCSGVDGAIGVFPPSTYTLVQSYSNKAAKLGGNPCVPKTAGQIYYNAGLVAPDMVSIIYEGQKFTTKGVKIPTLMSRTLEVDVFSDAATPALRISANDLSPFQGGPKLLEFSFDQTHAVNGEKVHVTIKALQAFPKSGAPFLLYAELPDGRFNIWPGLATN